MNKKLTREQSLKLDIDLYNSYMEHIWPEHKKRKNLSGDLHDCKYCSRKYVISCICDEAVEEWDRIIAEIQDVSEWNRMGSIN